MATLLVTGAAGFIGSHTCDQLLARGHTVVGVDDFRTGKPENLASARQHQRFRFEKLDVAESALLERVATEVLPDAIIHLAALVSVPQSIADPALNFRLNVQATQRVIDAAAAVSAKRRSTDRPLDRSTETRVVFASSAAVYGDNAELPLTERSETRPISPYGGAKLASEALLLGHAPALGLTVRCQRYFNVFGPRQDPKSPYSGVISIFCDKFGAGAAPTIFGDGEQTRDFISVHDVARANVLAATTPGLSSGIANICTGKPTSLNRLALELSQLFSLADVAFGSVQRASVSGAAPAPNYAEPRAGDIRHSLGSPERAKAELGFTAEVPLETALAELARASRG